MRWGWEEREGQWRREGRGRTLEMDVVVECLARTLNGFVARGVLCSFLENSRNGRVSIPLFTTYIHIADSARIIHNALSSHILHPIFSRDLSPSGNRLINDSIYQSINQSINLTVQYV